MWKKWPRISLLSFRTNRHGDALTGGIGSRTVSTLSGQTSKSSTKIWIFVTISWGGWRMGFIIHLFFVGVLKGDINIAKPCITWDASRVSPLPGCKHTIRKVKFGVSRRRRKKNHPGVESEPAGRGATFHPRIYFFRLQDWWSMNNQKPPCGPSSMESLRVSHIPKKQRIKFDKVQ